MVKLKLFTGAFLLTTLVLTAFIYVNRPKERIPSAPNLIKLNPHVFLTSQLEPESVPFLKQRGIRMIVDIRPDGEARDQAPSSVIESASKHNGINFQYIPVPHEGIPDGAVTSLSDALYRDAMPAVLYCRTGRRAARAFALVEASRIDGPDAEAILGTVRKAGFSAEDIKTEIAQRVSQRDKTGGGKK